MRKLLAVGCLGLAITLAGLASWMHVKSFAGQVLLTMAWQQALETGEIKRAWPWADTWPVARLRMRSLDQSLVVLEGVTGEAMAFGPGRVSASSSTAASGTFVVGGHRDSHLQFLKYVQKGDVFELETADGARTRYLVSEQFVANADDGPLNLEEGVHALVLITCFPFNALQTGGPLRYVVVAMPETDSVS